MKKVKDAKPLTAGEVRRAMETMERAKLEFQKPEVAVEALVKNIEVPPELATLFTRLGKKLHRDLAQEKLDPIRLAAWEAAVKEYESTHKRRANDALPKRIKVYLRWRTDEPFSNIQKDYPDENLSRLFENAITKDMPKLKGIFPVLPDLI